MNESFLQRHLVGIMALLVAVGFAATSVVVYFYISMFGGVRSASHELWAQFGDYIGGVLGSVFALLALIALLMTLRLQSRELTASAQELRNSAAALSEQNRSLQLQNFENRFFNMLSLHHQIVNGMDLRTNSVVVAQGRDCLRVFYRRLREKLESAVRGDHVSYVEGVLDEYQAFYKQNGHEVSHYFRHLYRVLKFVHESKVIEDKKDYTGILRAQLSNAELALLFYNGLTSHGEKLKPLAVKYALFENMELELLAGREQDLQLYDRKAFGDRQDM